MAAGRAEPVPDRARRPEPPIQRLETGWAPITTSVTELYGVLAGCGVKFDSKPVRVFTAQ
jgi:hypothetical protein